MSGSRRRGTLRALDVTAYNDRATSSFMISVVPA